MQAGILFQSFYANFLESLTSRSRFINSCIFVSDKAFFALTSEKNSSFSFAVCFAAITACHQLLLLLLVVVLMLINAHKYKNIMEFGFLGSFKPRIVFFPLIHVKMPTIVGILTFMSG